MSENGKAIIGYYVLSQATVYCITHVGVYRLLNHPITDVCIMGDVVMIDARTKFISYEGIHMNMLVLLSFFLFHFLLLLLLLLSSYLFLFFPASCSSSSSPFSLF